MLTDRPPRGRVLLAAFLDSDRHRILDVPRDNRLGTPALSIKSAMQHGTSPAAARPTAESIDSPVGPGLHRTWADSVTCGTRRQGPRHPLLDGAVYWGQHSGESSSCPTSPFLKAGPSWASTSRARVSGGRSMLATRQPLAAHGPKTLPTAGLLSRAQPVASMVFKQQVRGRTPLRLASPGALRTHRAASTRHLEALASIVHFARTSAPHAANWPHVEHRMMRYEGLATFDHRGVLENRSFQKPVQDK
jgi:hypothetical protein